MGGALFGMAHGSPTYDYHVSEILGDSSSWSPEGSEQNILGLGDPYTLRTKP